VAHSYDGFMKEDKDRTGKVKFVPAPEDANAFLAPWLARREAEGAGPEDYVFPPIGGGKYEEKAATRTKQAIDRAWRWVAKCCDVSMTWYEASRHSFTSRNLEAGASLEEVSAAIGHSSPVVTQRFYNRFRRTTFSPTLRAGLDLGAKKKGAVIPFSVAK
jgi:integrase